MILKSELPEKALSIRQPWATAIIDLGKDIENRDWRYGSKFRGDVCVHAAKTKKKAEWPPAIEFIDNVFREIMDPDYSGPIESKPTILPEPYMTSYWFGCIIGVVEVVGWVDNSQSPWWMGPGGLVLRNPRRIKTVIPVRGQLGFFDWRKNEIPW